MTEITTCPTCGGRCTKEGGSEFGYIITKPLPQPDLTKLREAFEKLYSETYVFGVKGRSDVEDAIKLWDRLKILKNAIKEVLECKD